MKKKKIILILLIIYILIFGVNTTYSMYNSKIDSNVELNFAKIIFNNEEINSLSLPINNIIPGEQIEYDFLVANNKDGIRSEINIGYTISVITFKLLPVKIELYADNEEFSILECNEKNFDRNEENKLVCTTEEFNLDYSSDSTNQYKLKISFDQYNEENKPWTEDYSELIDFIDIKINSWQVTE